MDKLHGVITSLLTPFNDGDRLDEETLAQELEMRLRALQKVRMGHEPECAQGGPRS